MENCNHQIKVKNENGMIITYCAKCGKILDSKSCFNEKIDINWENNSNNGGQILHG